MREKTQKESRQEKGSEVIKRKRTQAKERKYSIKT